LARHVVHRRGTNAESFVPAQSFAAEFDQDAAVAGFGGGFIDGPDFYTAPGPASMAGSAAVAPPLGH